MLTRIVFGSLAISVLLAVAVSDAFIADKAQESWPLGLLLGRGSLIPVVLTGIVMLGVVELVRLLRALGSRPQAAWAALSCAVLMLSPWLCAGGIVGDSPVDVEAVQWQIAWLTIAMLGAVVVHLPRGATPTAVGDLGATWLVILYLGFLPSFMVQIRCDANVGAAAEGAWHVLIVLAVAFASDVGALFFGMSFGRHKLAPAISPGKTIEGFVGGVLSSVAVVFGLRAIANHTAPPPDLAMTSMEHMSAFADQFTSLIARMSILQAIIFGIVISIATQVGDLFESVIKRAAGAKDSSSVVPGMGGVLDVIDGVIFAGPVAWFLLTKMWGLV